MTGFKFQVERRDGVTVMVSNSDEDINLLALFELFREFAIAAGYSSANVDALEQPCDTSS